MMVNWRIIETDNKVLPVNSYSAKIFVKPGDNKTKVIYKSGFYRGFMGNDPPAELNDENSKKKVKIFIVENINTYHIGSASHDIKYENYLKLNVALNILLYLNEHYRESILEVQLAHQELHPRIHL